MELRQRDIGFSFIHYVIVYYLPPFAFLVWAIHVLKLMFSTHSLVFTDLRHLKGTIKPVVCRCHS